MLPGEPDREDGGGTQAAPRPRIPPAPTLARLQGGSGQRGMVRDGGAPVFSWWGPPVQLPSLLCWGQHHAWDTALNPRPLQRAWRGCLLRGKVAEGRSQGSGEQHRNAAGKGTLQGDSTAPGAGRETGARLHQQLVHTQNHLSVALSPGKCGCGGGIGPSGRAGAGKGLDGPRGSVQLRSQK